MTTSSESRKRATSCLRLVVCAALTAALGLAQIGPTSPTEAMRRAYSAELAALTMIVERAADRYCEEKQRARRDQLVADATASLAAVQGLLAGTDRDALHDAYVEAHGLVATLIQVLDRDHRFAPPFYPVHRLPDSFTCSAATRRGNALALRLYSDVPLSVVASPNPIGKLQCRPLPEKSMYGLSYQPSGADVDEFRVNLLPEGALERVTPLASFRVLPGPVSEPSPKFLHSNPGEYASAPIAVESEEGNWTVRGLLVELPPKAGESRMRGLQSALEHRLVKKLTIVADRLAVNAKIALPGAQLIVCARHVHFEKGGQFVTTKELVNGDLEPKSADECLVANAERGIPGGIAVVLAQSLSSERPEAIVFDLRGGRGQSVRSGWGREQDDSLDGVSLPVLSGQYLTPGKGGILKPRDPYRFAHADGNQYKIVFQASDTITGAILTEHNKQLWKNAWFPSIERAMKAGTEYPIVNPKTADYVFKDGMPVVQRDGIEVPYWPGDGKNAVPAPAPGVGGVGGSLVTTLTQVGADLRGGENGRPGKLARGGQAGEPRYAMHVRHHGERQASPYDQRRVFRKHVEATHVWDGVEHLRVSRPGADASPRMAPGNSQPGSIRQVPADLWAATELSEFVLEEAERAYRMGKTAEARTLASIYGAAVRRALASELRSGPAPAYVLVHGRQRLEARVDAFDNLARRIALGLDYFGNPPGWVPRTALAFSYLEYERELENAVRMIYHAKELEQAGNDREAQVAAAKGMVAATQAQISQCRGEINRVQSDMAHSRERAGNVARRVEILAGWLRAMEAELTAEAVDEVAERRRRERNLAFMRKTSDLLRYVPHPAAQIGAAALDGAAALEEADSAADVFAVGMRVAKDWRQLAEAPKSWGETELGRKFGTLQNELGQKELNPEGLAAAAAEVVGDLQDGLRQVEAALAPLREHAVSDAEVQREFAALSAEDPRHQDLVAELESTLREMQEVNTSANEASEKLASLVQQLGVLLQGEHDLAQELAQSAAKTLSSGTRKAARSLAGDAERRLQRCRYYLTKAWEYEMLESGWGLGEDVMATVVGEVENLLAHKEDDKIGQIVARIYLEELKGLGERVMSRVRSGSATAGDFIFALNAVELAELNRSDRVVIDPVRLMMHVERERKNPRITGFALKQLTFDGTATGERASLLIAPVGMARFVAGKAEDQTIWFRRADADGRPWFEWSRDYDPGDVLGPMRIGTQHDEDLAQAIIGTSQLSGIGLVGRPGLCGELEIRRQWQPGKKPHGHGLTSLVLEVKYDYEQRVTVPPRILVETLAVYDPKWLGLGDGKTEPKLVRLRPRMYWEATTGSGRAEGREQSSWMAELPVDTKTVRVVAQRAIGPLVFAGWFARQESQSVGNGLEHGRSPVPRDWMTCVGKKMHDSPEIRVQLDGSGEIVLHAMYGLPASAVKPQERR